MNNNRSPMENLEAARSAYRGMIVAAPLAAAAWLVMLGGIFFLR